MSSGDELNINGMQNLVCTVYNNNTVLTLLLFTYFMKILKCAGYHYHCFTKETFRRFHNSPFKYQKQRIYDYLKTVVMSFLHNFVCVHES